MLSSLLAGLLLPALLLLAGCGTGARGQVLTDTADLPPPEPEIAFPLFFDPEEQFIDVQDFAQGWKRFTAPGGRLTFLHPPSWRADGGEWTITRTVFVENTANPRHPVDILLTVHDIGDLTMEEALEQQYERIRLNPLTANILRTTTSLLDTGTGTGRTIVAFRTTLEPDRSFLHLLVPRNTSILEIETLGTDPYVSYPVRILLESITFRD